MVVKKNALFCLAAVLILGLAACAPPPTPFPVAIPPTPPPTTLPSAPLPIRYALAPNTRGLVADSAQIAQSAHLELLTDNALTADELGSRYDLVAGYGEYSGWSRSPVAAHVSLVINTLASPFDQALVVNLVRRSLNVSALTQVMNVPGTLVEQIQISTPTVIRTELANLGYPDGMELNLAYMPVPGAKELASQLQLVNFDCRLIPLSAPEIQAGLPEKWLHLALIVWTIPEARQHWVAQVGESNVIDLYTLPISYRATPDLKITFGSYGFPIPER